MSNHDDHELESLRRHRETLVSDFAQVDARIQQLESKQQNRQHHIEPSAEMNPVPAPHAPAQPNVRPPVQEPAPSPAPPPQVDESTLSPSKRPSVRDSFLRGACGPVGTKVQPGTVPTVASNFKR